MALSQTVVAFLFEFASKHPNATLLEFGSGSTTNALCKRFKHVVSIEHDEQWAVKRAENHDIYLAPIVNVSNDVPFEQQTRWYDPEIVKTVCAAHSPDLILVDGPLRMIGRAGFWTYRRFFNLNVPIIIDDLLQKGDDETRLAEVIAKDVNRPMQVYPCADKPGYHFAVISDGGDPEFLAPVKKTLQFTRDVGTGSTMRAIATHVRLPLLEGAVAMEIGCFEGRTSRAILDYMQHKQSILICIDPFLDKYLPDETPYDKRWQYFSGQHDRFMHNTKPYAHRLIVHEGLSQDVLPTLQTEWCGKVDFVFIDGDHRVEAVYNDAKMSFPLIKEGGWMIFDDYTWGRDMSPEFHTGVGIDQFIADYADQLTVLDKSHNKAVVQKRRSTTTTTTTTT